MDVKAEHFERQLHRAEQEKDAMEKKYEVRALVIQYSVLERGHTYLLLVLHTGYSGQIPSVQSRARRACSRYGRDLNVQLDYSFFCFRFKFNRTRQQVLALIHSLRVLASSVLSLGLSFILQSNFSPALSAINPDFESLLNPQTRMDKMVHLQNKRSGNECCTNLG